MALNSPASASIQITRRNPGPRWGFAFLCWADRVWPRWILEILLRWGTWVAVWRMPEERNFSAQYLALITGRKAERREIWQHFYAFTQMFMLRLRVSQGQPHDCILQDGCEEFEALMRSGRPALLGTFHVGNSDLLGFQLGHYRRRVHMIRLRVGNSADTAQLERQFGEWVKYIWVNDPANMLFALKDAVQQGGSIALKCDRPDYSAKLEPFFFLGQRRQFPVTIYHLALMFRLPVVFCFSVPRDGSRSALYSSPVLEISPDETREDYLRRARPHFQAMLGEIEGVLRLHPEWWFNFTPMNPVAVSLPAVPAAVLAQQC